MVESGNTCAYRNIQFEKIKKGWIMKNPLPGSSLRFAHWCRFFTVEERRFLDSNDTNIAEQIKIMEKGIDRAYSETPIYTGDLRDMEY